MRCASLFSFSLSFFLLFLADARSIKLLARIFQGEIYRAHPHSNAANTRQRSQALNASTPISATIMPRPLHFSLLAQRHRAKTPCSQTSRFKTSQELFPAFSGKSEPIKIAYSSLDPCSISNLKCTVISIRYGK